MESDAFKIPLRSNPSTLPNVFPTILLVQSQAFKTNRKAFLLSLFKKACLIWSIRIVSRETDESYWLSRCGQAQWFSLQSQLSGERIKGLASSTVTAPHQSSHTHSELCDCFLSFIIPDSPSAWRTYAGSRCLEFHPQRECSWDSRRPLASGSKQRNGHLLHTSDSTCIQNSDLLWHTPGKSMIKPLWDDISLKACVELLFHPLLLFFSWPDCKGSLPISPLQINDTYEAQEHHLLSLDLKCTALSFLHLQFQAPQKHALRAHIDRVLEWHTSFRLECFFSKGKGKSIAAQSG